MRRIIYFCIANMFCIVTSSKVRIPLEHPLNCDTIKVDTIDYLKTLDLNEVVIIGKRIVIDHKPDRIVYYTKNDPYAKGLNGIEIMQRLPRVSVTGEAVRIAGKSSIRYILDGRLLETSDSETLMKLKTLHSDDIEKIEVLTVPPAKYPADDNVAYISIKMKRDETLGVGGNVDMNLILKKNLNSYWGAGIKQATKRIDYSVDINFSNNKEKNDLYREYTFADYSKLSQRRNDFRNRNLNFNTLLKYRLTPTFEMGMILNLNAERMRSDVNDMTLNKGITSISVSHSPAKPDNAATFTAYCDWKLDTKGKQLSLTYNLFDKDTRSYSYISTTESVSTKDMTNSGKNRYRINSLKLDATLPFPIFDIETGGAYTTITNSTSMEIENNVDGIWTRDMGQSNSFDYTEKTSALYVTASKSLFSRLFAKIGLRYEHTDLKGYQINTSELNKMSYDKLFPTFNVGYNSVAGYDISASYSMGISRPRFMDLNPFRYYATATDYVSGNAYLNASTTNNAEVSFGYKGLYAVLYANMLKDGVGYITIFNADDSQYTIPKNYIDYSKYGIYVSYLKNLTTWWSVKLGAELFYAKSKSRLEEPKLVNADGWSGKLEGSSDIALNRKHTLLFNLGYIHIFPHNEEMARYKAVILLNANLRYHLLGGKLQLNLSISDPFLQNITKMTKVYSAYTEYTKNNIHARNVSIKLSYLLGRKKVRDVYRDSKESESSRSF